MDTAVGLPRNAVRILWRDGGTLHSSPAARLGRTSMNNLRRRQALALTAGALASSSLPMPRQAHALVPNPPPPHPPVKLTLRPNNTPHGLPFPPIPPEPQPPRVANHLAPSP